MVTPTRVKNARRKNAAREPTAVVLAPFSAKSVVTFEDIPVAKTARRFINITNPCDEELEVRVSHPSSHMMNSKPKYFSGLLYS